jgi:hypothetical protein
MLVLAAEGAPPGGVHVDIKGKTVSASDQVVTTVVGALERMWSRTLDWAESNPIQFACVIVLFAFIAVQIRRGRTERAVLKTQYEAHRDQIRNQEPPLPLPPPAPKE